MVYYQLGLLYCVARTGFATSFNRFKRAGRNPSDKNWQKPAKSQMTKTVGFLVSNCLKYTSVCLDVIGTYCELCLVGFLAGDYIKCASMLLVTIGICLSARKAACNVLHT